MTFINFHIEIGIRRSLCIGFYAFLSYYYLKSIIGLELYVFISNKNVKMLFFNLSSGTGYRAAETLKMILITSNIETHVSKLR